MKILKLTYFIYGKKGHSARGLTYLPLNQIKFVYRNLGESYSSLACNYRTLLLFSSCNNVWVNSVDGDTISITLL